jgi:tetratricopeptide (TPR) repeat protein
MKRNLFLLHVLFVFVAGQSFCSAQNVNEKTAITLYNNRQYQEALAIWNKMANSNSKAGLYFNIGLAESHLHNLPGAIYAYEQSLRLQPLNEKYARALEQERKKLDNPVIPLPSFFLERWYLGWITFLRPGAWAILGLIIIVLAVVMYLLQIQALPWKKEIPKSIMITVGLMGLICLVSALFSNLHLYRQDEGIIFSSCELRQASSPESPVLRKLSAGEKVTIKDKIGDWNYVALLNLDYGWVKSDCIRLISISGQNNEENQL